MNWLSKMFSKQPRPRTAHRTTLNLEPLEARDVPTVTYHGGNLLSNVEAQGVYLGYNWVANSTYYQQAGQLDGFVKYVVNSTYMDALTEDGYRVGRGSAADGVVSYNQIDGRYYLTDAAIRQDLQALISRGAVQQPDANRLYVIFVEPGVAVMGPGGSTSDRPGGFLGYHGAFTGFDAYGYYHAIRYAVVTYPGAGTNNFIVSGLGAFDSMTTVASHEIAEAVTDPDVNYYYLGWYDDQRGEIGDITAGHLTRLGAYYVQEVADQNDNPTPLPSQYEGPALNYLGAGYTYGYYDWAYGSHSTNSYYAYVYGYYAYAYAQLAAQTHNATYWLYANYYGSVAENYAYADYAATGNTYAYYAYTFDYYGSAFAYNTYRDEAA